MNETFDRAAVGTIFFNDFAKQLTEVTEKVFGSSDRGGKAGLLPKLTSRITLNNCKKAS